MQTCVLSFRLKHRRSHKTSDQYSTQYQHNPNWILQGRSTHVSLSLIGEPHPYSHKPLSQLTPSDSSRPHSHVVTKMMALNSILSVSPALRTTVFEYVVFPSILFLITQHLPCQDLFSQTHYWGACELSEMQIWYSHYLSFRSWMAACCL